MDNSAFVPLRTAIAVGAPRHRKGRLGLSIYGLYDQRDGLVRYVGVTKRPLSDRLLMHKQRPTNAAMRSWLSSSSNHIAAALLETVPKRDWQDAERGWIAWFRQRGVLYNVDQGGIARDEHGALLGGWTPGPFREPTRAVVPHEPIIRRKWRARAPQVIVPLAPGEVYVPPFDYRTAKRLAEVSARQMASLAPAQAHRGRKPAPVQAVRSSTRAL